MKIVKTAAAVRIWVGRQARRGRSIGFVPTMGALHEGHLSLIRASRRRCDRTVVSVFVNPTQFGPREDYRRYPRDLAGDAALCRDEGVDLLFAPAARILYPNNFQTGVSVRPLGEVLEGASRPDHFRGVATIICKLFQLVRPQSAFFGQKDYQQAVLVRRLVADLHFPIRVIIGPTIREPDGLALSSRNRFLSSRERPAARVLFESLVWAEKRIRSGERSSARIRDGIIRLIERNPRAEVDYAAVVRPESLEPVRRIDGPVVLLLAAWIGRTRLIDNLIARPDSIRRNRGGGSHSRAPGNKDR